MQADASLLAQQIVQILDDGKAENIVSLNVTQLTSIADYMIICTGNSARHTKALAKNLHDALAQQRIKPHGTEGEEEAEWILLDYTDVIVHIMQKSVRDFYNLEKLWSVHPPLEQKTG